MLLLLALGLLALSVFVAAQAATLPARERRASLERAMAYGRVDPVAGPQRAPFRDRVLGPLGGRLAAIALRLSRGSDMDAVRNKLLAAGFRKISAENFLALKLGLGIGGIVLGLLFFGSASLFQGLLFAGALGMMGFRGSDFFVSSRARKRGEHIQAELPNALDILAVSVEAGLGFDGAVQKLIEHMDGPLAEEFSLMLGEIRIGQGRQQALRRMTERVESPEMGAFVRAVIQADQLGISLARILKVQASDTRVRRQLAAEEKAMKAPIKMLFPTVAFIFPAMFIVILGPAFLNFANLF